VDDEELELEAEVLTYGEFQRQATLDAWRERRRAYESGSPRHLHGAPFGGLAWIRQAVSRLGGNVIARGAGADQFTQTG
jgi:hypothetical protein